MSELLTLPAWLILLVTAALVFAEDALFVGFVLPAETIAVLAGVAAKLGHVSLAALLAVVVVAAVVGDSVGYEVGRRYGTRLLAWHRLDSRRPRIENAQALLARRGGPAVFLGRFTAFLRAVTPALAGLSRMPYRTFFAYNSVGGLLWGVGVVLIGYLAGSSYLAVEDAAGKVAGVVVAVVVVLALVVVLVRRHRSARRIQAPASRADGGT